MSPKTIQTRINDTGTRQTSGAGVNGAAAAPPAYGIDFLDRQPTRVNRTGLPDPLKAGVENLSGLTMDDVRVHYHSPKPAQLQALAYTQGTDIHVAPGQEKHLPHEAWHVVQQKQGRVKPTLQMKGVAINDDAGLEREADRMGEMSLITNPTQNTNINLVDTSAEKEWIPQLLKVDALTIQRTLLPVAGSGSANDKLSIATFFNQFGQVHDAVAEMLTDNTVRVQITINRTDEGDDHETKVVWLGGRQISFIDITLNPGRNDDLKLVEEGLLHELVLHAVPAYIEHAMAQITERIPIFPTEEKAIAEAEDKEHKDFDSWYQMAIMALNRHDLPLAANVITDWIAHWDELEGKEAIVAKLREIYMLCVAE